MRLGWLMLVAEVGVRLRERFRSGLNHGWGFHAVENGSVGADGWHYGVDSAYKRIGQVAIVRWVIRKGCLPLAGGRLSYRRGCGYDCACQNGSCQIAEKCFHVISPCVCQCCFLKCHYQ